MESHIIYGTKHAQNGKIKVTKKTVVFFGYFYFKTPYYIKKFQNHLILFFWHIKSYLYTLRTILI